MVESWTQIFPGELFQSSSSEEGGRMRRRSWPWFCVCGPAQLLCVCVCVQKPRLLARVCRVALLLWFLLLALLLLASFLLPFVDESNSCSFTNNFARSFNIMLRYHGPPPTWGEAEPTQALVSEFAGSNCFRFLFFVPAKHSVSVFKEKNITKNRFLKFLMYKNCKLSGLEQFNVWSSRLVFASSCALSN